MNKLTIVGDPNAVVCEGDSCAIPEQTLVNRALDSDNV